MGVEKFTLVGTVLGQERTTCSCCAHVKGHVSTQCSPFFSMHCISGLKREAHNSFDGHVLCRMNEATTQHICNPRETRKEMIAAILFHMTMMFETTQGIESVSFSCCRY